MEGDWRDGGYGNYYTGAKGLCTRGRLVPPHSEPLSRVNQPMPHYIQPGVEELRTDPSPGEYAELVLVPTEGAEESLRANVDALGIEITRDIEFGMMAVRVEETAIDELCEVADLQSITFDEEMEVLDSGNP